MQSNDFGDFMRQLRKSARSTDGVPGKGLKLSEVQGEVSRVHLDQIRIEVGQSTRSKKETPTKLAQVTSAVSAMAISRIEDGQTLDPRPWVLQALADIYGVKIEVILRAYLGARYFRNTRPASILPTRQQNGNGPPTRPFFISNVAEIIPLDEIFRWESRLAEEATQEGQKSSLWIISSVFLDGRSQKVLEMVIENLIQYGCDITYFIDESDVGPGREFDFFLEQAARLLRERSKFWPLSRKIGDISCYAMTRDEMSWTAESVVIGNPHRIELTGGQPEGYSIISVDDASSGEPTPAFGLELSQGRLRPLCIGIRDRIRTREQGGPSERGLYRTKLLTTKLQEISK